MRPERNCLGLAGLHARARKQETAGKNRDRYAFQVPTHGPSSHSFALLSMIGEFGQACEVRRLHRAEMFKPTQGEHFLPTLREAIAGPSRAESAPGCSGAGLSGKRHVTGRLGAHPCEAAANHSLQGVRWPEFTENESRLLPADAIRPTRPDAIRAKLLQSAPFRPGRRGSPQ